MIITPSARLKCLRLHSSFGCLVGSSVCLLWVSWWNCFTALWIHCHGSVASWWFSCFLCHWLVQSFFVYGMCYLGAASVFWFIQFFNLLAIQSATLVVLRLITPWSLAGGYQRFWGTHCQSSGWRWAKLGKGKLWGKGDEWWIMSIWLTSEQGWPDSHRYIYIRATVHITEKESLSHNVSGLYFRVWILMDILCEVFGSFLQSIQAVAKIVAQTRF